ncbi:tetratricopeptide repeat protein [Desulfovibrio desulfuricans]|uniref:Tetratricopeptide repeat protein n=2 Tax=Desulfovibrio TaxID=872 RepID=A0A212KKL7_9BACT|nr:tetratricopeptide repeat protein [Desulfovibrio desulfuricans]MBD8895051.1 tetratricopeptide repeat protein [Desulfovibrio desulfuricans]MCB6541083.1 tetratricopeptide repeat protein [Desulfovibrio desulfuricans]MCB6552165.1 tetratricopeptide repeat protein [Desulfovibrio desulfuricans]MCB6564008.1 tetratricopeptide repeat protein [Desulfovibrio desulfuricans]MCB7344979.1 tetratricopeptide repeat protein [Desulfovibrio desulfuricans]
MTEKIEWYKEVLELEPNSKVFFPLARLLSEAGRTDEAVEILEQGLARHEEFLEARLFLIELLHTANRLEACEKQVGRLTKMFSTYAGFWQAWAACINAAGDAPDTAAVLRFLALNFSKGPVSLHEVINQGLASLSGAGAAAGAEASSQARSEAASPAAGPSVHEATFAAASTPARPAVTGDAAPVAEAAEQLVAAPVLATSTHDADAQLDADVHIDDVDAHEPIDFDPDLAMADDEALPAELEDGTPSMLARGADAYAAYAAPVTQSEAVVVDDADEGEERFSLRTRSMAEVLAEQGDIKGALDIYHELAAAAVHPEESADLRQRITTLTARLGNAQTVDPVQPAATAEHASGKDKLISMLEALAERVEARAHS